MPSEWQAIETAPKQVVLDNEHHEYGPRILLWPVHGEVGRGRWWQSKHDDEYRNFLADGGQAVQPTHWMPLPDPPC